MPLIVEQPNTTTEAPPRNPESASGSSAFAAQDIVIPLVLRKYHPIRPPTEAIDNSSEGNAYFVMGTGTAPVLSGSILANQGAFSGLCSLGAGPRLQLFPHLRTAQTDRNNWIPIEAAAGAHKYAEWVKKLIARVTSFVQLSENWDGYEGKVPSVAMCVRALDVALKISIAERGASSRGFSEPFVVPLSSGGILFEVQHQNRELHIAIHPEAKVELEILKVHKTGSGDEIEEEKIIQDSQLPEVLAWLYQTF
jgi:hypothetical protein